MNPQIRHVQRAAMSAIYLAGPFARHEALRAVAHRLGAVGHTVTSTWLDVAASTMGVDITDPVEARKAYYANRADILRSDALLIIVWAGESQMSFAEAQIAEEHYRPHHWVLMGDAKKLPILAHGLGAVHASVADAVVALSRVAP
jgi:nucleoside 2-deoxyribosyltransferase